MIGVDQGFTAQHSERIYFEVNLSLVIGPVEAVATVVKTVANGISIRGIELDGM